MLPRWMGLGAGAFCAALAAASTGALAALLEPAVNPLLASHADLGTLGRLPLILAALALGRGLASVVQSMLANRVGIDLVSSLQVQLIGRLMHADLARLRASHTGAFVSLIVNDTAVIRDAATTGFLNYIQSGLTLLVLLGVMLSKDWLLTLFVLLAGPAIGWVLREFSKRVHNAIRGSLDGNAALATAILESLGGARVAKIEGREDYETARVARVIAERRKHVVANADARAMAAPVSEILTMLLVAAVIAYFDWRIHMAPTHLGALAIEGLTPGGFTAFLVALMAAGQSLRQFASLHTMLAEGIGGARRLFVSLDREPQIRDKPRARPMTCGAGALRFEAVTFGYNEDAPVLEGISFEARRGETVALVGPSGGGKSTILALIPRFYDALSGRVTIDQQDVRDVTLSSLRAHIGLVTQESFLFDDTIAANIGYAKAGASQVRIESAARQAAAHDFILDLPQGYDTRVGEAGLRLSGGQRQRIAIARAFLKDAPILLLDEATSALDSESEAQIQAALARLMSGRTTVMIAHRLSTVRAADRIYVIDRGRLVETGSHGDLLRLGGLYARLAGGQNLDSVPEPA